MKKGIVVYYSQAGSTQKIAQAVHLGMKKQLEQCDLARLREIQPQDLDDYDLVGLGSPVWSSRPSWNMTSFIESLASLDVKHFFYFCTHGSMPGPVLSEAVSALRRINLTVIGAKSWYGSVFLPYMPKPYYTDGHPDEIDLSEAEEFGAAMVERSRLISQGVNGLILDVAAEEGYLKDAYKIDFNPAVRQELKEARSRPFKINEEKCSRCMLCAENCISDNIDFSVSPPVFKTTNCARCWYCEQICPEGAIEYDWGAVTRAMAKYDGTENIEKELEAAEKEGRFRRLVPFEDVGRDTPWYKVSQHPRLLVP